MDERLAVLRLGPAAAALSAGALWFGGCAVAEKEPQHDQALAVVWMQRAGEHDAACLQAYGAAQQALAAGISDRDWTACLEQDPLPAGPSLPPCVVLDVDETVLDNSPFAARQIRLGKGFEPKAWAAWVKERRADAVPGALAYVLRAKALGARVIYLTNRNSDSEDPLRPSTEEADTRANLAALGFPIDEDDGFDCVLTAGEHGDKAARRRVVARRFRIVQLVGDNLGDFAAGTDPEKAASATERADRCAAAEQRRNELVVAHGDWWGRRWILIPNPSYGGFESVVRGQHDGLHAALDTKQP